MGRRTIVYEPGELVKWFEPYADGIMTKDAGYGVIIRKREHNLGFSDGPYITYIVFRTKHNDKMIFETMELQRIENDEND